MIELKAFQVRDDGTHIPIVAFKVKPYSRDASELERTDREVRIMARAGFDAASEFVVVVILNDNLAHWDPLYWRNGRTMYLVHMALSGRETFEHAGFPALKPDRAEKCSFDAMKSGDVIDVEWMVGETDVIKEFE